MLGAIALAYDRFGVAALAFVPPLAAEAATARGTARGCATRSPLGDAVDRYREVTPFLGLAVLFRSSPTLLALVLLAMTGRFMLEYGSAKAEAVRVSVPRALRGGGLDSACLWVGVALTSPAQLLASHLPAGLAGLRHVPVVASLVLVAAVTNASAVLRLRAIASSVRDARFGGVDAVD
jgi:hypothetical protein